MSSKKDISQIRKYLNGELDARAMHELERRAQDDPFLMDALEGYETTGGDQQTNLDDLSARLRERTDVKVKRLIPWVPVSIAASILIVIGVGLLLLSKPDATHPKLANVISLGTQEKSIPAPSASPQSDTLNKAEKTYDKIAGNNKTADTNREQYTKADANAPAVAQPDVIAKPEFKKAEGKNKDTASVLREVTIANANKNRGIDTSLFVRKAVVRDEILKSKAEGVTVTQKTRQNNNELRKMGLPPEQQIAQQNLARPKYEPKDSTPLNEVVVAGYAAQKKKDLNNGVAKVSSPGFPGGKVIMGRVTGKDDGQPVVGATVKVVGTNHGAVTNVNGQFALTNVNDGQTLAIAYIGYNTREVKVNNKDTLNVALDPNSSSLSEVVVTGYGVKHNDNDTAYQDAAPADGWPAFRKYLAENAKSPDGKTGRVRISFTVDADGHLGSFKILKSLSAAADQKATDLLQHGPKWVGATDGKPHKMKITLRF